MTNAEIRSSNIFAIVDSDNRPRSGVRKCRVCGCEVKKNALAMASHGKKHAREGQAVAELWWGFDGRPRTAYVLANKEG